MVRSQRRQEPNWFVCAPHSTHANRWFRWQFNWERRLGLHDTGTVLFGTHEDAVRHAGEGRVRPPFPHRVSAHNGLACWGYMQPAFRPRTLRLFLPVMALTGAMALTLAWLFAVLDPAEAAGDEAVQQWRSGRVPDHYYGANPQPACVTPIGPLDELPLYGHRLDPGQVYGTFGVTGGEVTLWDPDSGEAFSVPSGKVQVLPVGEGEPGSSISRTCRSGA